MAAKQYQLTSRVINSGALYSVGDVVDEEVLGENKDTLIAQGIAVLVDSEKATKAKDEDKEVVEQTPEPVKEDTEDEPKKEHKKRGRKHAKK